MMIGTFLGSAYEADRDEPLGRFIRSMLDWAGVAHPMLAPPGVEIRTLISGADRIAVAFNHNAAPAEVALAGVDLESGAAVTKKTLDPQDVWIVKIRR